MTSKLILLNEYKRKKSRQFLRSHRIFLEGLFRDFQNQYTEINITALCLSSVSYHLPDVPVSDDYLSFREKVENLVRWYLGKDLYGKANTYSWFDPNLCGYDTLIDAYVSYIILNLPDNVGIK